MKCYEYIAKDMDGERRTGLKDADSTADVVGWLREQQLTAVSVNQTDKVESRKTYYGRKKIKSSDLSAMCWQLSTMINAGVSITKAVDTIAEDTENPYLKSILENMLDNMNRGQNFSDGVYQYPKVFNKAVCSIIKAGESSGSLGQSLQRMAAYFDAKDELKKKVITAISYPIFVFTFVILIVAVITTFIIPRFEIMFEKMGGDLPVFTKAFMGVYEWFCANAIYIAGFTLLLIIVLPLLYTKTRRGHILFSKIVLKIPLFGTMLKQAFVATLCRTMSTLMAAGVSVVEVFEILCDMTDNDVIKSSLLKTKEQIIQGSQIATAMSAAKFFPKIVVQMTEVGERSGTISSVLDKTSAYFERKVNTTIATVMSLVEPIMIITVGSIVLVVLIALYLPILSRGG